MFDEYLPHKCEEVKLLSTHGALAMIVWEVIGIVLLNECFCRFVRWAASLLNFRFEKEIHCSYSLHYYSCFSRGLEDMVMVVG